MLARLRQKLLNYAMGQFLETIEKNFERIEIRRRPSLPEDGTLVPATPITYEFYKFKASKGHYYKLGLYNPEVALEPAAVLAQDNKVVEDYAMRELILQGLISETRAAMTDPKAQIGVTSKEDSVGLGYKKIR